MLAVKLPRRGGPVPPEALLRAEFLRACRLSAGLRSDRFWVSELQSVLQWVQCLLAAMVLLHFGSWRRALSPHHVHMIFLYLRVAKMPKHLMLILNDFNMIFIYVFFIYTQLIFF